MQIVTQQQAHARFERDNKSRIVQSLRIYLGRSFGGIDLSGVDVIKLWSQRTSMRALGTM